MQFLYHKDVGVNELILEGEEFHYLCRVRRFGVGKVVALRNLRDGILYRYEILEVGKKSLKLELIEGLSNKQDCEISESRQDFALHLLWAIIDPKVIEKSLPTLNELGVAKITFFYAQYSQHSFKPNLSRMEKILIQSCQQCGRAMLMELEILESFEKVCERYEDFSVFDFGGVSLSKAHGLKSKPYRIMVGPEGGFSQKERERFKHIFSLPQAGILRSESACIFLASASLILD